MKTVVEDILRILNDSGLFGKITKDKDVSKFTRLVVPYSSPLGKGEIFIDLNERGKVLLKPEMTLKHFYPNIPEYKFLCLNRKEMVAEKMAATIGRNKPRDHYDLYKIINSGLEVDLSLVRKKCRQSGHEFSIVKMFNRAKKLNKRWKDLKPLLVDELSDVMKTLAKRFNLQKYR